MRPTELASQRGARVWEEGQRSLGGGAGTGPCWGLLLPAVCVTNLPRRARWKWGRAACRGTEAPSAAPPGTSPGGCIRLDGGGLVPAGAPVPPHGLSLPAVHWLPWGPSRACAGEQRQSPRDLRPASEASPLAHSVEARPRPSRVGGWWMGVISTGQWRGAGICGHVFLQLVPLWPFLF